MFGNLFRRATSPTTSAANPGKATEIRTRDAHGKETRVHAAGLLAEVLRARGHKVRKHASWLTLDHGFVLLPRVVEVVPSKEHGRWQTITTIETHHPDLFPSGVFEFQHNCTEDVVDAVRGGFEQFESLDLPVLRAAISNQSKECAFVEYKDRYHTTSLTTARRIVLGPVSYCAADSTAAQDDAHPFCPCCFFTNTHDTMKEKVTSSGFFAVRLLVVRHPGERTEADCRVNGVDWMAGKEALLAYAATWPDRGFEMRKQYVVIQDLQ